MGTIIFQMSEIKFTAFKKIGEPDFSGSTGGTNLSARIMSFEAHFKRLF
jgi:hypothetical protein